VAFVAILCLSLYPFGEWSLRRPGTFSWLFAYHRLNYSWGDLIVNIGAYAGFGYLTARQLQGRFTLPAVVLITSAGCTLLSFIMESLPPKNDVASSGLIWSTVFSPIQRQIFSVVAESNGLFPEAFSTQASVAERINSVRKLWVNSSLNSFFADSLHAQSRSVQARGVRIFMSGRSLIFML